MSSECLEKVITSSIQRLTQDAENGFEFLQTIPSIRTRIFTRYWFENGGAEGLTEYLRSIPYSIKLGSLGDSPVPKGFAEFAEKTARHWEFRTVSMKQTLGMMFLRRGRLAEYRREGATDEDLRVYGNLKWHWPSKQQIVKAFGKRFEMQLLHREDQHSAKYQISTKRGVNVCSTRLIINSKIRVISYSHMLNGSQQHFQLIDHSGGWRLNNWDLVTGENLDEVVGILGKIVADFESTVD